MKALLCFFAICLAFFSNLWATNIETFNGTYTFKDKDCFIAFKLNNGDISRIRFNKKVFDKSISCEFLGVYGSTGVFEISVVDQGKEKHLINLLILHSNDKVLLVSGFYVIVDLEDKSSELRLKYKKTVEMQFNPSKE